MVFSVTDVLQLYAKDNINPGFWNHVRNLIAVFPFPHSSSKLGSNLLCYGGKGERKGGVKEEENLNAMKREKVGELWMNKNSSFYPLSTYFELASCYGGALEVRQVAKCS